MFSSLRRRLFVIALIGVAAAATTATGASRMLIIERVEVRTTKKDGRTSWDPGGGAPDLKVMVERTSKPKGETHITATQENRFQAIFHCKAMEVEADDVVEIRVLDADVGKDDEVGKTSRKITRRMLKNGEIELAFDQVNKLVIRFKP